MSCVSRFATAATTAPAPAPAAATAAATATATATTTTTCCSPTCPSKDRITTTINLQWQYWKN